MPRAWLYDGGMKQIDLGSVTLLQAKDGKLYVTHATFAKPVPVDAAALARWLLKFLREQVTV